MKVIKRNGQPVPMLFDKVTARIHKLCVAGAHGPALDVQPDRVAQKVFSNMYDGINTSEIDSLSSDVAIDLMTENPDYEILATRIAVSNMHKTSPTCFSTCAVALHAKGYVSDHFIKCVLLELDSEIHHERDYTLGYFGIKTLQKGYLFPGETPQYLFMRVALGIHGDDYPRVKETYHLMSQKFFTHATPTLFNAGTTSPQMSSCFLVAMKEDSVEGIFETLKECAHISKWSGGIGVHCSNIRANGSLIMGTKGKSDGIVPMLRVFNNTARYINQCFRGDTTVYSRRGPIPIDNVKIGDQLVTIDGSVKNVLGVVRNHVSKNILCIRPMHSMEPVHVTAEHEIYAIQGQKTMLNHSVIKNRLVKRIVSPGFVSAGSLKKGDFVGFPIPTEVVDFPESVDYFRMYGIMIGDGYMTKKGYECGVCLGSEKKLETLDFVKNFLKARGIRTWFCVDEDKHTISVRWANDIDVLNLQIYDSNREKRIDPQFLNLPRAKTLALIKGLMETDGGITHEVQFYNTSKNVMYSLRYLLMRIGVLTSGHYIDNVGSTHEIRPGEFITNRKPSWALRIPKHPALRPIFGDAIEYSTTIKYFEHEGIMWSRIRGISETPHDGPVYDLNMEDNHNYMTDMGLVHNSGKRKGSFAFYLEPWHADVMEFLDLRLNQGDEEARCRDLFTALWIPDLFMQKVEADEDWHLMCPNECPGLQDSHGESFNELYRTYVAQGRFKRVVKARTVWDSILRSQIETGTPYMCYKDSVNEKSNQKNIGTIKSSNLCVAPETKILTKNGYQTIETLSGETVEVWNGHEWSEVVIHQTSEMARLMKAVFSNGATLECTPEHKFHIDTRDDPVRAKELKVGDRTISWINHETGERVDGVEVTDIMHIDKMDATYCFNEPKRHMGIFNGIITGNCTEIMEVSTPDETAVCNLASISLPAFVKDGEFDYDKLQEVTQVITRNLNRVIDRNFYPTEAARRSNMRHRPVAIGVQGLADVFQMLGLAFDEPKAREINEHIFMAVYYAALTASCKLAQEEGPYETFAGSPASQGILQFDMWEKKPMTEFNVLKEDIKVHGLRNSLLVAPMPTASTAQIMGNNEAFEPYTTNIYLRRTLAGEFVMINKHLVRDLQKLGLWSKELKDVIIAANGSVQNIEGLPASLKLIYRTVWEIPQKSIIDMAADRGAYIDQSQSMNIFMENPTMAKLSSMHMYGWKKGLKTGMYYLRTRAKAQPIKFTLDPSAVAAAVLACSRENPEACMMCSG